MSRATQTVTRNGATPKSGFSASDLAALPKAHLHMHFAGSVPRAGLVALEKASGRHLSLPDRYADLPAFLSAYSEVVSLIRSDGDVGAIAYAIAMQEHRQGVVYVEPSVSPRTFGDALRSPEAILAAVIEGFDQAQQAFGIGFGVLVSGYWQSDADTLVADAQLAARFAGRGVTAFGIAGDETATWNELAAQRACAIAREAGLAIVPHAGEAGGAENVARVIGLLRPDRIAHGVRALEDERVLDLVAESGVALDVCPTSNIAIGVLSELSHLRIDRFLELGIPITINADDSLLFGVHVSDEYAVVAETFGLGRRQVAGLARNSIAFSTATIAQKSEFKRQTEHWERAQPNVHDQ